VLDDIEWDDLTLDTLRTLVASKVPEGERLDYKREVYGKNDNPEIAKDISALANTQGGHLVIGISEAEGEPTEIVGLGGIDPDAEIRRMDDVLRTSVQPSITGVRFKPIRDGDRLAAIVVRVPKSWRAPHQVVANSTYRFYGRRARSNAPLDVDALRSLFSLDETIGDRIRRYREERLALIVNGNTPAPIRDNALVVWHAVPSSAFALSRLPLIETVAANPSSLVDLCGGYRCIRRNIDGVLCFEPNQRYAQLFRNGVLEVVCVQEWWSGQPRDEIQVPKLRIAEFSELVLEYVSQSKKILKTIGAEPPVAFGLTLKGMKGWNLWAQNLRWNPGLVDPSFDRDVILAPDQAIETLDTVDDFEAKALLDMIWQAAGWPEAKGFDAKGKWAGRL
jgi:hypothetical protein